MDDIAEVSSEHAVTLTAADPDDLLVTEIDAAKRYGIPRSALATARRRGKGPTFIRLGGRIFYEWEKVKGWRPTLGFEPESKNKGITNRIKDLTLRHPEASVDDLIRILCEEGYTPNKSTVRAFQADTIDIARRMVELGLDPEGLRQTQIFHAARARNATKRGPAS